MNDDSQAPLIKSWRANSVLIGLNADCWLGINGVNPTNGGTNYINAIKHEVATLEANGLYPIISLFWSAPGATQATSQASMPDNDHSPAFWQSVANTFKSDPAVIFRLKEEPFPAGNSDTVAAWTCWKNGDVQYDASGSLTPISNIVNCSEGYPTVGMQSLINIIRGTGATNVIQVPGVQYANSMTHFLDAAIRVSDTLNPPQLMADVDVYPIGNICNSTTCYDTYYAPVAQVMPFMAGETGESVDGSASTTTNVNTFIMWLDAHGAGYSAWVWDTWGQNLQLITDYTSGNPKAPWGTYYYNHLQSLVSPPPSPTVTISSPANNSTFAAGQPVAISVAASDPAGVTSITISGDGTQLATCNATTCSASWSPAPGTHTIQAVATDTGGRQGSKSVTITVQGANPPTVAITSPVNGATYTVGQTVNIAVSASDQVGVASLAINGDTTSLATCSNTTSCAAAWTPAAGTHTISATATGTDGQQASTSVSITVNTTPPPSNPTVTITSPPNGSTYVNGGIPISATASDPAGISRIQIFGDQSLLQTCNNVTSCSTTWQAKRLARGQHTITVTATDPGALQGSASETITVATHHR
jgi:hypothetical protein